MDFFKSFFWWSLCEKISFHYIYVMTEPSLTFPWMTLIEWYKENGRHNLEWRDYTIEQDILAYRIWLSEIFLQQTQVERVRGYFDRILKVYPTVNALAWASYEVFFPYYQWMGYYSRARNLLKTASIISTDYAGKFPREKSLLQKLPGVWWYTSSAIMAFGFWEAYLAWDTNLEKVFARYFHRSRLDRLTETEKNIIEINFRDFIGSYTSITDREKAVRAINNALMDFAATIDLKNPDMIDWDNYPIQSGEFYATRGALEPREIKKSQSFPTPDATVIVILHKDHKEYYSPHDCQSPRSDDLSLWNRDTEWQNTVPKSFLHSLRWKDEDISYHPFILPSSLTRDTRKYVQDFFREKYGLELSVRPAHKKWISEEGKPYIVVNAQIQVWEHPFIIFKKK